MKTWKSGVAIAFAAVMVTQTLPTRSAFGASVNRDISADPEAALTTLNGMNIAPLSDDMAASIRGEGWVQDAAGVVKLLSASYKVSYSKLLSSLYAVQKKYGSAWYASTVGAEAFGWELGRWMAIKDGYPDPGSIWSKTNVGRLLPIYVTYAAKAYKAVKKYK